MLPVSRCFYLAVSKRNSDIVRGLAGANPHQDVALVVGVCRFDRVRPCMAGNWCFATNVAIFAINSKRRNRAVQSGIPPIARAQAIMSLQSMQYVWTVM
jgi:hypothetical protein